MNLSYNKKEQHKRYDRHVRQITSIIERIRKAPVVCHKPLQFSIHKVKRSSINSQNSKILRRILDIAGRKNSMPRELREHDRYLKLATKSKRKDEQKLRMQNFRIGSKLLRVQSRSAYRAVMNNVQQYEKRKNSLQKSRKSLREKVMSNRLPPVLSRRESRKSSSFSLSDFAF